MNTKSLALGAYVLLCFALAACATLSGLNPGSGSKFKVTDRSYDEVWNAAVTVATRVITIESTNKETGAIKGHVSAGMATGDLHAKCVEKNLFPEPSRHSCKTTEKWWMDTLIL